MASRPDELSDELRLHLDSLESDVNLPVNEKLFDECSLFLAAQLVNQPQQLIEIIERTASVLFKTQQDPSAPIRLLTKLVEPLTFSDINSLQTPINFVAGLARDAQPYNLLVLDLLSKATKAPKDAAVLAGMPQEIAALVRLWLTTADMGVADRSLQIILDLLHIDKEPHKVPVHGVGSVTEVTGGQGFFWRRLFGDRDVYGLIYSLTSLSNHANQDLSKREKTIAQARLLLFLPPVGVMDWSYITRSHHPDIEQQYGLKADSGLLQYASLYLIDYKDDVLLHMNLLAFFADLIASITTPLPLISGSQQSSVSLDFLMQNKLHDRAMSFWLDPENQSHDPLDVTFLYGPSAHYTAVYIQQYPDALLASRTLPSILTRLSKALSISSGQWVHGDSPKHDLSVLSALPRSALLPQATLGTDRQSSPLLQIPNKVTNEDALHTLSKILGGPRVGDGTVQALIEQESQTAPILFHLYFHYYPSLFADLITHADTVALPNKALAALTLLSSIVSAKWLPGSPLASTATSSLHSHSSQQVFTSPIPILLGQSARDRFLPYILRAPRTFSNIVGGRGDSESATYRIAMAKWDCLMLFDRRLKAWEPEEGVSAEELGLQAVKDAVTARIAEGVWGSGGQDVGGRIATMEL